MHPILCSARVFYGNHTLEAQVKYKWRRLEDYFRFFSWFCIETWMYLCCKFTNIIQMCWIIKRHFYWSSIIDKRDVPFRWLYAFRTVYGMHESCIESQEKNCIESNFKINHQFDIFFSSIFFNDEQAEMVFYLASYVTSFLSRAYPVTVKMVNVTVDGNLQFVAINSRYIS